MTTRDLPQALAHKLAAAAARCPVSFDDVRMDDLAAASGIPRATLYYYFAGKDDILAFLLRSMLDDLRVSVEVAVDGEGDTSGRLHAVIRAQLEHLAANPTAAQLLLLNLGRAGRVGVIAAGIDAGFQAPVRKILADGVAGGELVDRDTDLTAAALYGAVTVVGMQALVSAGGLDVDAVAERLFRLFWSGAAPRPRGGRSER